VCVFFVALLISLYFFSFLIVLLINTHQKKGGLRKKRLKKRKNNGGICAKPCIPQLNEAVWQGMPGHQVDMHMGTGDDHVPWMPASTTTCSDSVPVSDIALIA
jgi:hypothetical protein